MGRGEAGPRGRREAEVGASNGPMRSRPVHERGKKGTRATRELGYRAGQSRESGKDGKGKERSGEKEQWAFGPKMRVGRFSSFNFFFKSFFYFEFPNPSPILCKSYQIQICFQYTFHLKYK